MILHAVFLLLPLLDVTFGHAHDRQHSHFCLGGGYNLFCSDGYTLHIDKAWFGRIAADADACLLNATSSLDNATVAPPQPHLTADCGASVLGSKGSWCREMESGGCTIMVTPDLAQGREDAPCPHDTVRYLYLEYECTGSGAAPAVVPGVQALVVAGLLAWGLLLLAF